MARMITDELYPDLKLGDKAEKRRRIQTKIKLAIARGGSDPVIDALMSANSDDQKVAVLLRASGMTEKSEFDKFLMEAVREKVISPEVRVEVVKKLK